MNSPNRIGELVPLLEKFEFPHCDVMHENVVRDRSGIPIERAGMKEFTDQCPIKTRFLRPACNHCEGHEREPLSEMAYHLGLEGKMASELRAMEEQHKRDMKQKTVIDEKIRDARTGPTLFIEDVPCACDGQKNAASYVMEHRAIVDRMRAFTIALLAAAKANE